MTDKNSKVKEVEIAAPQWFKLDNYNHLSKLDAHGWFQEITRLVFEEEKVRTLPYLLGAMPKDAKPPVHNIMSVRKIDQAQDIPPKKVKKHPYLTLCLDLRVADDLLFAEIWRSISEQRKSLQLPSPGSRTGPKPKQKPNSLLTKQHFRAWTDQRIVGYMELELWARDNNIDVTDTQIGGWLFPGREQPARIINKTRKVWLEAVRSLPALQAQIQTS